MIQFDDTIFQMGWFNHQLDSTKGDSWEVDFFRGEGGMMMGRVYIFSRLGKS